MLPAQECFDARDATGVEPEHRLVVEAELSDGKRASDEAGAGWMLRMTVWGAARAGGTACASARAATKAVARSSGKVLAPARSSDSLTGRRKRW